MRDRCALGHKLDDIDMLNGTCIRCNDLKMDYAEAKKKLKRVKSILSDKRYKKELTAREQDILAFIY